MKQCIFCDIVASTQPASIVFRDDLCCAFMDIRPVNPGHTLVIPVAHASSLTELDEHAGAHIFKVGQRIASALRKSGLKCEGINFHLADGSAAGQEIFHVHLHVVPRFRGDGFGLRFGPHYGYMPPRAELNDIAAKVSSILKNE